MAEPVPAPVSTATVRPRPIRRFTVSGVAATLASGTRLSLSTARRIRPFLHTSGNLGTGRRARKPARFDGWPSNAPGGGGLQGVLPHSTRGVLPPQVRIALSWYGMAL